MITGRPMPALVLAPDEQTQLPGCFPHSALRSGGTGQTRTLVGGGTEKHPDRSSSALEKFHRGQVATAFPPAPLGRTRPQPTASCRAQNPVPIPGSPQSKLAAAAPLARSVSASFAECSTPPPGRLGRAAYGSPAVPPLRSKTCSRRCPKRGVVRYRVCKGR